MMSEVLTAMKEKMKKSIDAYRRDLTKIRTGRASLALLDGIKADSYGSMLPLNQVATLTIPESRMIAIQPWDPQALAAIEKAILKSNIGLTPMNDGKLIRISIPQLTEDRRKELVKQVKKTSEEYRVAIRNCRRDAIDAFKKQKKNKEISEDDLFKYQDEAQKQTDSYIKKIDEILADKEKEVMAV
jgi:ribosome recycling factor